MRHLIFMHRGMGMKRKPQLNTDRIKAALPLFGAITFIYVANAPHGTFLGTYYRSLGIATWQIGILLAVGSVATLTVVPLWGYISDRTGRRKLVLRVVVAGAAVMLLAFYLTNGFWSCLLVAIGLSLFTSAIAPLCEAIVVHRANQIGASFAHIRSGGTVGFAVMVALTGLIVTGDVRRAFILSSAAYVVMLVIIQFLPADDPQTSFRRVAARAQQPGGQEQPYKGYGPGGLYTEGKAWFVMLFVMVTFVGGNFIGSYMPIYLLELGYNATTVGFNSGLSAISELPMFMVVHRFQRKFDVMHIMMGAGLLLVLRMALLATGVLPLMLLGQATQGFTTMLISYMAVMYISEHIVPGRVSQGQTVLALITSGIGSLLGQVGGGRLSDWIGLQSSFLVLAGAMLVLTAAIFAAYCLYQKRRAAAAPDVT